jgi:membrane fusion protein (multidrug efflux system)
MPVRTWKGLIARPDLIYLGAFQSLLLAGGLLLAGCDEKNSAPSQTSQAPPAVIVAKAERQPVTQAAEFVGRIEAIDKVEIRARVTGFLEGRHFREGQDVKAGDPLFTIERVQFEAEVAVKAAKVASAQAQLVFAEFQVDRARELVKTNATPRQTLDQRVAEQGVAAASVQGAQADLRQALVSLNYTEIKSPLDGRIGRSTPSRGDVVGPDSGVMTVVVRQDPINVTFPVSQRQLLEIRKRYPGQDASAVKVKLRLSDGSTYAHIGRIDFVDVQTDKATDTALVQAQVPNPDRILSDGQFVGVTVEGEEPTQAVVIPQAAVQMDQAGAFVLAVGPDNKVEQRRIKLGRGPAGQSVVESGLDPGTMVIVEGAQRARPGSPVSPRPAPDTTGGGAR